MALCAASVGRFVLDFCLATAAALIFNNSTNVLIPPRQCLRLLGGVLRAIVDAGDASLMSADVVQHGFDDVRLDADAGHAGGARSAQVVKVQGRR